MWLLGYKPLKVIHRATKFGGDKHCCSRDKMFLICHEISKDHMIQESCEFIGGRFWRYVNSMPILVAIGTVVMEK